MSKIRRVLSPYDFSETSERALAEAGSLARRHGARLQIVHVVEPVPVGRHPVIRPPNSDLALAAIAEERVNEVANRLRKDLDDVDVRVRIGKTGSEIVSIAEAEDADVIVIGTRGLNPLKHLLLGSTAEYVVRRSAKPVLAIHPHDSILEAPIETVVVPTDLSLASSYAVDSLLALFPQESRPAIHLVHADSIPPYLAPFSHAELARAGFDDPGMEDLLSRMEEASDYATRAGFDVEKKVIDGEAASAIPTYAERIGADLIVMNTHGRSAVGNFLRGRIAQRVVQHAPCPVLTSRAPHR